MLVMIELELRRLRHDRTEIYTRAVQPILWIVIYGPVMSSVKAIPTGGVPYTDFITPGVMIQTTTFVSIFYGLTIVWERESGILKKLLVTPASRYSMVIGRSMASGVRAIFQALIILPIASANWREVCTKSSLLHLSLHSDFLRIWRIRSHINSRRLVYENPGKVYGHRPSHNHAAILRKQRPISNQNDASNPKRIFSIQPAKLRCRCSKGTANKRGPFKSPNRFTCNRHFRCSLVHFGINKLQAHHRITTKGVHSITLKS
jgi:hypothetical protein